MVSLLRKFDLIKLLCKRGKFKMKFWSVISRGGARVRTVVNLPPTTCYVRVMNESFFLF